MTLHHISELLEKAATDHKGNGIIAYRPADVKPQEITYDSLRELVLANSKLLRRLNGFSPGSIVLIHFEDHLDNIIWLWSTIYAGCIPAVSTAFPRDVSHCQKHLAHLQALLDNPVFLTRSNLRSQFPEPSALQIVEVDDIENNMNLPMSDQVQNSAISKSSSDLALLMLTSGSTGNSKAVRLTHQQLMASLKGKSSALRIRPEENLSFLNWIRLDHVGSLIEIHMHALFVGASQVHVQPGDIIASPVLFLEKIHKHRVGRTFAPNFFLGELSRAMESGPVLAGLDLSCLKYIVSGGEANPVSTCVRIAKLLGKYGAPDNVIVPGSGMTETCAGSIYNLSCPSYDLAQCHEFASLGHCIPGIQMRVDGATGGLELTGLIVFSGYYNNEQATADAFTADGWFKTGDTATIDIAGKLNLSGRTKELIAINGLKFLPKELEAAIEEEMIEGVAPGYVVCLATRPSRAQTEQICVVYLPTYSAADANMRYRVQTAIARTVLLFTGSHPYVLPLGEKYFQRTTLGKLSASKLRLALERGDYRTEEALNMQLIKKYQASIYSAPANKVEQAILEELETLLGASEKTIGVNATMFEVGLTSVDLLKLKRQIEARLRLDEVPLITMMKHPTIRDLANALQERNTQTTYDPVVRLSSQGAKTPLWLIHPGVGEILVFLNLAKFIVDRPVYALRARGFNPGETHFKDIPECVATYYAAIKEVQPCGPYAIAGYSYGSMLAFEVAKVLEHGGDDVRFVGAFNLPPHIKLRMRQLDWTKCLLHLSGAIPDGGEVGEMGVAGLRTPEYGKGL
jgi:acyl-CoA synthetase (AMP-forming)/AMP-acid ligase II